MLTWSINQNLQARWKYGKSDYRLSQKTENYHVIPQFVTFRFRRVPNEIILVPEHFQKWISPGTEGALDQVDTPLPPLNQKGTLQKWWQHNLSLNEDRCEFPKPSVEYPRSIIGPEELHTTIPHASRVGQRRRIIDGEENKHASPNPPIATELLF